MFRIPRLLKWIISIALIFLLTLTLYRFIFYFKYQPEHFSFPGRTFLMGLRYDLRPVCILGLFMLLCCIVKWFNPFKNPKAKTGWTILLTILFLLLCIFLVTDYFHYEYLGDRLNASVLNYLEDAGISMHMVWQTYPVFKILIIVVLLVVLALFTFSKLLSRYQKQYPGKIKFYWIYTAVLSILLLAGIWGTFSQFALRWSNVYTLGDPFKAKLALNPVQSFFSTLAFRNSTYDIKTIKQDYPLMSDFMDVEKKDSATLNFARVINPSSFNFPPNTNVILVICESFSAYKSSMWGNPLNTTPYFAGMCRNGVFFDHCFTPSYGTARGVWASLTGIPDVESPRTASRNPSIVDQHTLINDFEGYDKYYFLGGDANWANIRGLFKNNIDGLKIYEQEDFKASRLNVWGISDKNLFLEANSILSKEQKPFFAVIQTADNHRPYSIPSDDLGEFKKIDLPDDSLKKFGFESNDELNAFRYTDFCYGKFIEAAKTSPYFKNTVFVFVGDHGVNGSVGKMFPSAWQQQELYKEHVPLLFYCPAYLPPARISSVCSQLDILPSVAGMLSKKMTNTAMGKNLFDSSLQKDPFRYSYAFINDPDEKKIGLISGDYYLRKNLVNGSTDLFSMVDNSTAGKATLDSIKNKLAPLTNSYLETAKYLLYHNQKHK